jgi:hypothetical protein
LCGGTHDETSCSDCVRARRLLPFSDRIRVRPAQGHPENWCRNGAFPRESKDYRLAKIKGAAGERIYFHDDGKERCPAEPSCRSKAYVIPDDQVIVSRTFDRLACSWFQPRKGSETVGWIETDRLEWVAPRRASSTTTQSRRATK